MEKLTKKQQRELEVLRGLIELYIDEGKPVGSNTLKEKLFPSLSSATLRNYFSHLEKEGFLIQHHTSGGRTPTQKALRFYWEDCVSQDEVSSHQVNLFSELESANPKELHRFLQQATETFSQKTGFATFLSSVRFDHDYIESVKLITIDEERTLIVMLTEFGQILTEVLSYPQKISQFTLKRVESWLQQKIRDASLKVIEDIPDNEVHLAEYFYSEIMVRYLVRYSNFSQEEVFRTGFAQLLHFPEFNDPIALTTGLSLFENTANMRRLLSDCTRSRTPQAWIGKELEIYSPLAEGCCVLAAPYKIGESFVGAVGILGPQRLPYQEMYSLLKVFTKRLSQTLTKSLHKYKISYRCAQDQEIFLESKERQIVHQTSDHLLDSKETEESGRDI